MDILTSNSNDFLVPSKKMKFQGISGSFFILEKFDKIEKFHFIVLRVKFEKQFNTLFYSFHLFPQHKSFVIVCEVNHENDQFSYRISFDRILSIESQKMNNTTLMRLTSMNNHINFSIFTTRKTKLIDSFHWRRTKFNLQLFHFHHKFVYAFSQFQFSTQTFLVIFYLQVNFYLQNHIWNSCLLQENCFVLNFVIPSTPNDMENIIIWVDDT
jgi:hypothetical protein